MRKSSGEDSRKGDQDSRGRAFEDAVFAKLAGIFQHVRRNVQVAGFSGINWKVDFLVGSDLIIEATVQRRLETKINSTFLRFADITRKNPQMRGALVVEKVHVLFHQSLGKRYFPTSEYRTFLAFGYPIIAFEDMTKLVALREGPIVALDISTLPQGFNTRSISHDRKLVASRMLLLLKDGPMRMQDLSRNVGLSRDIVASAARRCPEIKRVSTYYGLEEDAIYRTLLVKGGGGPVQTALVRKWLESEFVATLSKNGTYRTEAFARDLGVSLSSLTHLVHRMNTKGIIRRVGKGRWALTADTRQASLG